MKNIIFLALAQLVTSIQTQAQNLGIGIEKPTAKLHVYGNADVTTKVETTGSGFQAAVTLKSNPETNNTLQLQKWPLGFSGTIGGVSASNLSAIFASVNAGNFLTGTSKSFPVYFATNNIERLRVTGNGYVGIGLKNPVFPLEINGRSRIKYGTETAGIWFNNSTNIESAAFVGMYNNSYMGLYGSKANWKFLMSVTSGNVSLGNTKPNNSKLLIEGESGNALEISGGIKVSGTMPPAFQITANSNNLSDRNAHGYFTSIIIDNSLSNNDPNALLFIIPIVFTNEIPISIFYDAAIGKWKILAHSSYRITGVSNTNCDDVDPTQNVSHLALASEFLGFQVNDMFNVLVVKR